MGFSKKDFFIEIKNVIHSRNMLKYHYHNSYEVYYIASGQRSILYDGKIYDLHTGDMVLLCPNLLHKGAGLIAHKKIDIEFSKKFLDYYFTTPMQNELMRCFKNNAIHLNEKERQLFESLSQQLDKEYIENNLYAVTLSEILLLINNIQKQHENEPLVSHDIRSKISEKTNRVLSYIEKNFANIKSIDEIALHVYLNKNYLCRMFKKETNMTIMDYLYNYRIKQACEMLNNTDSSVAEIGALCGFESTSHFIKMFKSMLDCTPGKFRKKE